MNLRQALAWTRDMLADSDIEDASLEGEILLRHILGISRAQMYADLALNLSVEQENTLNEWLERRRSGEPSAYITGHREFYGLDFKVDCHVHIPRPESELLVESAIKLAKRNSIIKIADIGTGCGAIAISLAVNLPEVTIYATDISPSALGVAWFNCRQHNVANRVVLRQGDMLKSVIEPVDMIIANLPYVREGDLQKGGSMSYEPALALDGGKEGLDEIKHLCHQAGGKLRKRGYLLMEIGEGQAKPVIVILRKIFPSAVVEIRKDLAGIDRVVSLCLT